MKIDSTLERMRRIVGSPVHVPTVRPRWRHHLAHAAEALCVVAAGVGLVMALTRAPDPKPLPPTTEAGAWLIALDLAKATTTERALIPRPPVVYYPLARMRPMPDGDCAVLRPGEVCMMRLCGLTEPFAMPVGDTIVWSTLTTIYLLPSEGAFLKGTLVHEFLHTIWLSRAEHDLDFRRLHPDSETWVRALISVPCPAP